MWKISLLFFAGILASQFFPELPNIVVVVPVLLVLTGLAFWKRLRGYLWPIVVFLCGIFWAWGQAFFILDHTLDKNLEGKTVIIEGEVINLPDKTRRRLRFDLRVAQLYYKGVPIKHKPRKVRLSWYSPQTQVFSGEVWRFSVRLKRPHGWRNPGGFDYEGWLFQHRINATGYVVKEGSQRLQPASILSVDTQRQKIADKISELLPNKPYAGVIQALLMGDRSGLNSDYWATLVNTGTIHLMAISGLHIGIIFAWFYFIGRWLWVIYGSLALKIPAQKIGIVLGVLGALLYALLAGFSIPTQRAFIMVFVGTAFFLWSRRINRWAPYVTALFVVLLFDPLAVGSPGFWLSFWAVAIIFACLRENKNGVGEAWSKKYRIRKWITIQMSLLIGLSPILFYFFHKVSLVAPLANLVAVPWVGLIIIPLIFVGSTLLLVSDTLATVLLQWAEAQIGWLSTYLQWLEKSPIALWEMGAPTLWSVILALIGAAMIVFRFSENRLWLYRFLGVLLFIPMFLVPSASPPQPNEFKIAVLDIGQGLSVVVQTQQHTLVYDTGPYFSDRFNAVDSALLPYLATAGIKKIDQLVIGHADKDHSGGVNRLQPHILVEYVLGSEIEKFRHIFPEIKYCRAGSHWIWDGVGFELLSPMGRTFMGNNASCVLRVFTDKFSVLIPGDIEKEAEQRLRVVYGQGLKSDVIIAPHHGSLTSSTTSFLTAVDAQAVVFSTGYRNRFGFPKEAIVQRYKELGTALYNTAYDGAIIIDSENTDSHPNIQRYRFVEKRYWQQ